MEFVVDIDDPALWPRSVTTTVEKVVRQLADDGWREDPYDHLGWADLEQDELQLREQLAEYRVVGYHATRLLPYELADIRSVAGLEVLTEDLRQRKVEGARRRFPYALNDDDPEGAMLLRSGPNDWQGTADARLSKLDFVPPFTIFRNDARGLMNLFETWGGETLGLAAGATSNAVSNRLTELSEPAIVEFGARVPTLNLTPLLPAFAGRLDEIPGPLLASVENHRVNPSAIRVRHHHDQLDPVAARIG